MKAQSLFTFPRQRKASLMTRSWSPTPTTTPILPPIPLSRTDPGHRQSREVAGILAPQVPAAAPIRWSPTTVLTTTRPPSSLKRINFQITAHRRFLRRALRATEAAATQIATTQDTRTARTRLYQRKSISKSTSDSRRWPTRFRVLRLRWTVLPCTPRRLS